MNTSSELGRRIEGSFGAAVIGALCGAMLAAFASVVSDSVLSMAITLAATSFLGGKAGGVQGLLAGFLAGGMFVALSSVLGSSVLGAAAAIAIGAFIGAYAEWQRKSEVDLNRDWCCSVPEVPPARDEDGDGALERDGDLDAVFPRVRPLENPQVARWHFLRWSAGDGRRASLPSETRGP